MACTSAHNTYTMLIGTYTEGTNSKGIYLIKVDANTGNADTMYVAEDVVNPSYLAFSADKQQVYAVSENGNNSSVNAFAVDETTKKLQFINIVKSPDADPCYIAATDEHIVTAGYSSGSLTVHERNDDGSVGNGLQTIYHKGSSINAERQAKPHVHQTIFTPDQTLLLVCDLGTDKITSYRYHPNERTKPLVVADSITVKLGSGPRHLAFNCEGSVAYLLQEIDGTLTVLSVDKSGQLAVLQEVTTNPQNVADVGAAAIRVSPDGRFVYATNRGSCNNITCFEVAANGTLTMKEQTPTGGSGPRDFALTSDGKYVFVAHQYTHNITIFERNINTGHLTATGKEVATNTPVCVLMY
ncbi:6-phosphogluconolactonase [Bacteroidia bacterium]|nr:6-phosphogluconolactonase [Bacteroidia bacterium]